MGTKCTQFWKSKKGLILLRNLRVKQEAGQHVLHLYLRHFKAAYITLNI
jgi:hypothetical protein